MSTEHPTPITDAFYGQSEGFASQLAEANKARDDYFAAWTTCLRKRGELKERLAEARDQIEQLEIRHAATMLHTQSIVDDANKAIEQRDRLAGVLRNIRSSYHHLTDPSCDCDDCNFCRPIDETLATLDPADSRTFSSTPPKL